MTVINIPYTAAFWRKSEEGNHTYKPFASRHFLYISGTINGEGAWVYIEDLPKGSSGSPQLVASLDSDHLQLHWWWKSIFTSNYVTYINWDSNYCKPRNLGKLKDLSKAMGVSVPTEKLVFQSDVPSTVFKITV